MTDLNIRYDGNRYYVKLDGHDISYALSGLDVDFDLRGPTATLTVRGVHMSADLKPEAVELDEGSIHILTALGWRPPGTGFRSEFRNDPEPRPEGPAAS